MSFQEAVPFNMPSGHGCRGIYRVCLPFMNLVVDFSPLQMDCGVHHRDPLKENDFKAFYLLESVFVNLLR